MTCLIAPSILSANFARLGEDVDNVLKAGADWVHFDVMDNHYVPNLTIGPLVCEALRKHGVTAPIDVHLMVEPVDRLVPDFARLGDEVRNVIAAGADLIHFDVMDNHYVPNLTVGPLVCAAIKPHSTVPIDVHLMVKPVDRIIPDFAKAGASIISFHPEASEHVDRTLGLIREHGCQAGLVFNPATPLSWLDYVIDKVDMILIMSVNPGFGGQSFIPEALAKLRDAKQRIVASGRDIRLEVDGGVKTDNIGAIAKAGADTFVAGSAIFGSKDYAATIRAMRAEIAKSVTP
jgi:ribulose-phosphate 3-epimerase